MNAAVGLTQQPLPHLSLADEDTLDVLQLIRSENVGPVTFHHLVSFYGSVKHAIEKLPDLAEKSKNKRKLKLCPRSDAEAELEALTAYGTSLLLYGDIHYPTALAHISDAPPLLAMRGSSKPWQQPCVAIVGARNASANGCNFAKKIAQELGEEGITVVSGLARGIDSFAHTGSLESGTVGVIAGGIDNVYPPQNASLFEQMAEKGAILSENPFGAEPQARHFPSRNRIIAGMSQATLVIEANHKSGTLITANYALDYGRDVLAVPGSPLDPRCAGTNDLLKDGAHIATCAEDIIKVLNAPAPLQLAEPRPHHFNHERTSEIDENQSQNARSQLEQCLSATPILLDELLAQCDAPAHVIQWQLLEMELAGEIQRHPGGRVSRVY